MIGNRLLAGLALALITRPVLAGMMLLGAGGPPPSLPPPTYTDLCATAGMSGNCVYAYSVTHRLNSTNTIPFVLTKISTGATMNASYVPAASYTVNVGALTTFCLAGTGTKTVTTNYTTYNDCNFTEVFDQAASCNLTPPQANKVFQFRTWNADGYPILLGTINQTNGNVGTTVPWLHAGGCSALAGGVKKSIITYTSNGYGSNCCGEVGLMENGVGNPPAYPIAAVSGTMLAESNYTGSGIGPSQILMGTIDCEAACGTSGVKVNTSPIVQGVTVSTFSGTAANGGTNKFNTWWNNVAGDVNVTPGQTINTQSRMSIGCDGDLLGCGPVAVRDVILTSTDVSATVGLPAAIYSYLTNTYLFNAYTDLCAQPGLTGNCVYAFSVAHRVNSTNTVPFTLTKISTGATMDASYTGSNFLVNVSPLTSFCLAGTGTSTTVATPTPTTTYNDCAYSEVYDQNGTCNLTSLETNKRFPFRIDGTTGLPVLSGFTAVGNALVGTTTTWLTASNCNAVSGNASKTMINYSNNGYVGGTGSLYFVGPSIAENGSITAGSNTGRPIPVVSGSLFGNGFYHPAPPPANRNDWSTDFEGGGGYTVPLVTPPPIYGVGIGSYSGPANVHNEFFNNITDPVTNQKPSQTINTQARFNIGCSGDLTSCGLSWQQDIVVTSTDVTDTPGLPRAICLYEQSIMGGPGCPNLTSYVAIGDSITLGTGAAPTSDAFPYLIASDNYGIPLTDRGVTGVQACGGVQAQVYPNYAPLSTDRTLYTILLGTNDAINNPVGAHEVAYKLCLEAAASWLVIPDTSKIYAQAAAVTGSWAPTSTGWLPGIAEAVPSGAPGSTLTFNINANSDQSGNTSVIYIWYSFPSGGAASFTYAIDGGAATTVTYNGTSITGVVRIPGLVLGVHSVVITDTAGLPETIAAVGTIPPFAAGGSTNCCRTLIGGVPQQEGDAMSAVTAAYNADALSVASTLRGDLLNISGVTVRDPGSSKGPTPNSVCDTATCMFDIYHPNNLGHRYLANAFESAGPPTAAQSITSTPLAGTTFAPGSPSGTVVGTIGATVLSPASPSFVGTITVDDTTDFQIVGGNLETNGTPCPTGPCSFNINLIATGGYLNSPHSTPYTITAGATTNVIQVLIDNENVPPSSAAGTHIGDLSAKVTGGGACSGCVYTMVNSGASSDGPTPVNCTASSDNFQIGTNGLTGNPDLEVRNASLVKTIWGGGSGTFPSPHPPVCVEATPPVGASFTFPFTVMVRGPEITAVAPHTVQYTSGVGSSVTLSANICWTDCQQAGSPPTPSFTLGADAACTDPGISISGSSLNFSSSYAGSGICHITAAAAGVTCPQTGSASVTPTTCVIAVNIYPGAYVGPGDTPYPNGAVGGCTSPGVPSGCLQWTTFAGIPYGFSNAYCSSGTNPIWRVTRESDHAHFAANCLPSGDMDLIGLAAFCDKSMCVADGTNVGGSNAEPDQSGNSPANDMPAWGDHNSSSAITQWRPYVYFNVANGVPLWSSSNATDKFFYNPTTYNGSGATGTLWTIGYTQSGGVPNYLMYMAAVNTSSNPIMYMGVPSAGGAGLYVGPQSGVGTFTFSTSAPAFAVLHSYLGVVGGTGTNQSVLEVDGAQTFGTLSATASFAKPAGQDGEFGGGSNTGFDGGIAVSSSIATSTATTGQLYALCTFDLTHLGTAGPCT